MAADFSKIRSHADRVCSALWADRARHEKKWREIAAYFFPAALPGLADGVSDYRGGHAEVDDVPPEAQASRYPQELLRKGAAGFAVNLTSPAREWFRFAAFGGAAPTPDDRWAADARALEILSAAVRRVCDSCGIYNALNKLYEHLLAFGTGCLFLSPRRDAAGARLVDATLLRFGTYALGVGEDGRVDKMCRKFRWTVDQIAAGFGTDALPPRLLALWQRGRGGDDSAVITHLCEPHASDDIAAASGLDQAAGFRWRSIYFADFAQDESAVLRVDGHRWRPILAPRMEFESGDVWGRGRGIDALPAAKLLCALREDDVNVSGNHADPALFVSEDLQGSGVSLDRGAINYANLRDGAPSAVAVPAPGNLTYNAKIADEIRSELSETLLVSRFATIDALKMQAGVKTATEIDQLVRENLGLLGPIVSTLDAELLDPLLHTLAGCVLDWADQVGIDTAAVRGIGDIKIEYVSSIHRAQRADEVSSILNASAFVAQLAGLKADVIDTVDIDGLARAYFNAIGLPAQLARLPKEIEALRAARQVQQEQLAQAQQMAALASAAKDAGAGAAGFARAEQGGE